VTPAEQEARAWAEGVAAKLSDCNWDKDVEATFATTLAEHVLPLIQAKEEAEQEAIELGKAGDRATTEWHEALERERRAWEIAADANRLAEDSAAHGCACDWEVGQPGEKTTPPDLECLYHSRLREGLADANQRAEQLRKFIEVLSEPSPKVTK